MPDHSIVKATIKMCVAFQEASAYAYSEARMWNRDKYAPRIRVADAQHDAAMLSASARTRLLRLIGSDARTS